MHHAHGLGGDLKPDKMLHCISRYIISWLGSLYHSAIPRYKGGTQCALWHGGMPLSITVCQLREYQDAYSGVIKLIIFK